jgi:hypothetical protein
MSLISYSLVVIILSLCYMFYTLDKYNFCQNLQKNQHILKDKDYKQYKNNVVKNCNCIKKILVLNNDLFETDDYLDKINDYSMYKIVISSYYYFIKQFNPNENRIIKPKFLVGLKVAAQFKFLRFVHLLIYSTTILLLFSYVPYLLTKLIEKISNLFFYMVFIWLVIDLIIFEFGSNYSLKDLSKYLLSYIE